MDHYALPALLRIPGQDTHSLKDGFVKALAAGAPVAVLDERGYSPLDWAISNEYYETLPTLVAHLISQNPVTADGDLSALQRSVHILEQAYRFSSGSEVNLYILNVFSERNNYLKGLAQHLKLHPLSPS